MELNKDILRWVLLIGATPIWWPFLRALWRDFNNALREEGGLIGQPPSPRELEAMRQERRTEFDPLTSEPWVQPGERRTTRLRTPGPRAGGSNPARGSGTSPTSPSRGGAQPSRRGFGPRGRR